MAREPANPDDASAEPQADATKPGEGSKSGSLRTRHIVTGAAIGIGSAALVAALLYANRARKSDKA
jgi:hypothetical protein